MARELAVHNAVVPSVPLSPWVNPQLWGQALKGSPDIAIDFGTVSLSQWGRQMAILSMLGRAFDPIPRLVAYGVNSRQRIAKLTTAWPGDMIVVSRGPVDYASKGERLSYPDLKVSKDWSKSREDLIIENDRVLRAVVRDLIETVERDKGLTTLKAPR
jgi:hypothetical protein